MITVKKYSRTSSNGLFLLFFQISNSKWGPLDCVFVFRKFPFFSQLFNDIFGRDSTLTSTFGRHPFFHSQLVQGSQLPADCGIWFFVIYFYCLFTHHIAPFSNKIFAFFSFFLHYVSLFFCTKTALLSANQIQEMFSYLLVKF